MRLISGMIPSRLSPSSLPAGPETLMAATTLPPAPKTGAATQPTPSSISSASVA